MYLIWKKIFFLNLGREKNRRKDREGERRVEIEAQRTFGWTETEKTRYQVEFLIPLTPRTLFLSHNGEAC